MYRIFDVLKLLIVCVLSVLIIYLLYLFYLNITKPDVDIYLFNASPYTFETFLENLQDPQIPNVDEHQRLYQVLQRLEKGHLGNLALQKPAIPYDYRVFFQQTVPAYLAATKSALTQIARRGPILASFVRDADYVAKLLLVSGPDTEILSGTRNVEGYPKRLEMTGTYTSEFHYPTGLFAVDGEILNPVLQQWDGLLIVDAAGKAHIRALDGLEYEFRRFYPAESHQDYLDFLKLVEVRKLSLFQSHLLIKHGELDVSPNNTKEFRRRIIFEDRQGTISIYDSLDQLLTLYDAAKILKEQHGALAAINLDMGPYGYCGRYERGKRVNLYGRKGKQIELSNVLIFNYK